MLKKPSSFMGEALSKLAFYFFILKKWGKMMANNSCVNLVIEKWYNKLGFSGEFDLQFKKALEEIEISESAAVETFEQTENGKLNFLTYLYFCEKLKDRYEEKNIPENILMDTLKDIVIWANTWSALKGELYLGECDWLARHLSMKLFKLGRLQFCMGKAEADILKYGVKKGDNVIEIHIPEAEPLTLEECKKSIEKAKEFFKLYFPQFEYKCFTCHSWLLDNTLKEILKPESNIIKFQNMFEPVKNDESYALLRYIFKWDTTKDTLKDAVAKSSFAQKVKDRALSGGKFYETLGVIKK